MSGLEAPVIAALAMSGAGTAMSVFSGIQQGKQAKAQAEYQAQMADYNAQVEKVNAEVKGREYAGAEEQARRERARILGKYRASQGQSGLLATSGSMADSYMQSARDSELDALNIRYEGEMVRRGLIQKADVMRTDAANYRAQGKAAMNNGYLNAASSLLQGAGSAYGVYNKGMLNAKMAKIDALDSFYTVK